MPCVATNISGLSEIYLLLVISTMKKNRILADKMLKAPKQQVTMPVAHGGTIPLYSLRELAVMSPGLCIFNHII